MATNNLSEHEEEVAEAIRTVEGSTDKINPQDFAARILALAGKGDPIKGEIRIFYDNTKPASEWGGTWSETEFPAGTFLEAAGSSGSAGTNHSAGLPNITGSIGARRSTANETIITLSGADGGAFYNSYVTNDKDMTYEQNYNAQYGYTVIDFSAQKSNAIYGNSTTVQPKSRTVHIWRRVS